MTTAITYIPQNDPSISCDRNVAIAVALRRVELVVMPR